MSTSGSSSASSSSVSSVPAPPPTPWSVIARQGVVNARLEAKRRAALRPSSTAHRHAIESILAFLSLSDLAKANHVSRHWHNAVHHMRPLGATVGLKTALAECDYKSAMFRHVTGVQYRSLRFNDTPLSSDLLRLFATMPQLRSVMWQLRTPCEVIPWPATLTEIDLHTTADRKAVLSLESANLLLKSVSTSARALKRFTVHARLRTLRGLNFSFLLDLSELVSLYLNFVRRRGSARWRLGDSQVHVLRQLTHLTHLDFQRVESESLRRLLRAPHQLSLKQLQDFIPLNAQAADCFESLPTLTKLNAHLCSSVAFLSKLPLLATLRFDCQAVNPQEALLTADEVLQGLSPCKGLTALTLTAPLQSSHMIALLPRLPLLHTLQLSKMRQLDSLRCLSTGPVTSRLTSLTLIDCQHRELELNELGHLLRLKNLVSLWIHDSFNESLTAGDVANYTPPSRYFKRLRHFHHYRTSYEDAYSDYGTDWEHSDGDQSDDADKGEDADH